MTTAAIANKLVAYIRQGRDLEAQNCMQMEKL